MNLYFTDESRDTLKSLTLFITVKAIAKLNLGHRNKFEIELYKISRRSSRSSILGDPGATSRDDAIFLGESLLQELIGQKNIFLPNQR